MEKDNSRVCVLTLNTREAKGRRESLSGQDTKQDRRECCGQLTVTKQEHTLGMRAQARDGLRIQEAGKCQAFLCPRGLCWGGEGREGTLHKGQGPM